MSENPTKSKKRTIEVEQKDYTEDSSMTKGQYNDLVKRLKNIESYMLIMLSKLRNGSDIPLSQEPLLQDFTSKETPATPIKDMAVWDREKLEGKTTKKKGKFGKKTVIVFFVIVVILIVAMYLRSKGWTSVIPGL